MEQREELGDLHPKETETQLSSNVTYSTKKLCEIINAQNENIRVLTILPPSKAAQHSIFFNEDFISSFENEDLLISKKVLELVYPLVKDMSEHYNIEKGLTVPVESLREVAMAVLLEAKNEIGTGASDPTIQGALSYVRR
nr:4543_t:CDS:2 [Entrophospora candida]